MHVSSTNQAFTVSKLNSTEALCEVLPFHHEFYLFPELPTEIRLAIWNFALPDRRILQLHRLCHRPFNRIGEILPRDYCIDVSITENLPHTLLACKESREETLKRYKDFIPFGPVAKLRLDLDNDIVVISAPIFTWISFFKPDPQMLKLFAAARDEVMKRLSSVQSKIKRLAVSSGCFSSWLADENFGDDIIRFTGLEELIVCEGKDTLGTTLELFRFPVLDYEELDRRDPLVDFHNEVAASMVKIKERHPGWNLPKVKFGTFILEYCEVFF